MARDTISYLGHKNGLVGHESAHAEAKFWGARAEHPSNIPISRLSAGQRKRIALDRLYAEARPVWLLDEPYAALDDDAAGLLDGRLRAHLAGGGCAMVVSHAGMRSDLDVDATIRLSAT